MIVIKRNAGVVFIFIGIIILMTIYLIFSGYVSNKEIGESLVRYTKSSVDVWEELTDRLDININSHENGDVGALLPNWANSLDLVVLGDEVVNEEYKLLYSEMGIGRTKEITFITKDNDLKMEYFKSGVLVSQLADVNNTYGGVFFIGVPNEVVDLLYARMDKTKDILVSHQPVLDERFLMKEKNLVGIFVKYKKKGH